MFVKLYFTALLAFIMIDGLWLGLIAKKIYHKYLGYIMTNNVNWYAALSFYVLFIVGIVLFVVSPALEKNSLGHAIIYGAVFGLITYATYDLTNLATIKNWPITITMIDMTWGMILTSGISTITYIIAQKYFG